MLRDKRDYTALTIFPAGPLSDLFPSGLFPSLDIELSDDVFQEGAWRLIHCFLYVKKQFTNSPELLRGLSVRRNRRSVYKYSFYMARYEYGTAKTTIIMLAAPFKEMELFLIDHIATPKVVKPTFGRPSLMKLIDCVAAGQHVNGKLRLRGFEYLITADENGSVFAIEGQNVLRAVLYNSVEKRLKTLRAIPRSVRLEFGEETFRPLRMTLDRFGNFRFRISSKRENLIFLRPILDFLTKQDLLDSTPYLPLRAVPEDNTQ